MGMAGPDFDGTKAAASGTVLRTSAPDEAAMLDESAVIWLDSGTLKVTIKTGGIATTYTVDVT